MLTRTDIALHQDAVEQHHRFEAREVDGESWTFEHLDAFAFRETVEVGRVAVEVDVVVLFSCHCFTEKLEPGAPFNPEHVVMDGQTVRILNRERYVLSRKYLPGLVEALHSRHILIADASRPNFVTLELEPDEAGGEPRTYAMFFEVVADTKRKKRLLLRVQSAYVLNTLNKRLRQAQKMRLAVILKRAYPA